MDDTDSVSSLAAVLYDFGVRRRTPFEGARGAIEARMFPRHRSEATTRIAGRYVLDRVLGEAAFGTVYLARDHELDRPIALKVLHAGGSEHATIGVDLLAAEARALAQVSHPNVVAVFDVGVLEGRTYLAMEYVTGCNLRRMLGDEHAPVQRLSLLLQAGRGLAAAHAAGIVHRDLKPENVLVGHDGRVRVVDFGLARAAARLHTEEDDGSSPESQVAGTPYYMAPEVLNGLPATALADQYAFFVCVYEAAFGVRPFEAKSIEALVESAMLGAPRPPSTNDVPARVFDVIARGLDPDPERRHADMHAAVAALEAALRSRSRTRWRFAGLALLPAAGLVVWGAATDAPASAVDERCASESTALADAWTDERRASLWRATIASGRPYAIGSWSRVEDRIDRFVTAWSEEHAAVCEDPGRDAAPLDCLAGQRADFDVLLAVLQELGARPCAIDLPRLLGSPAQCRDANAPAVEPGSSESVVRPFADAMERVCGQARDDADLAVMEALVARQDPRPAVSSTAWYLLGTASEHLRRGGSKEALERAYASADPDDAANRVAAAAMLATVLAGVDVREAERWAKDATSLADRSGGLEERCLAAGAVARVAVETSDWERAERVALEGLALCGEESLEAADFFGMLGTITAQQQRHVESDRWTERRRDLQARNWAVDHPKYAIGELAVALVRPGIDLAEARAAAEHASAVLEWTLEAEHPDTLWARGRIGMIELHEGNVERAREILEGVWVVEQKRPAGDDPLRRLWYFNDLGMLYKQLGDAERELEMQQRALDHALEWLGEHPLLAGAFSNTATALRRSGRLEEALARFDQSIALIERLLGPSAPMLAYPVAGRAHTLSDLGRDEEALAQFERALAIASGGGDEGGAAVISALVAVRLPPSERARAVELAEKALPVLRAQGPARANTAEALERLLAEQG